MSCAEEVAMRLSFLVSSITLLSLAACSGPTARLAGPTSALGGNWRTAPAVPSGSGIDLQLATNGPIVTGAGQEYAILYLKDSFSITGRQGSDGTFRLTLTSRDGTVGTHGGHLVGSNEFRMWWVQPPSCGPDSLTFVREPQ